MKHQKELGERKHPRIKMEKPGFVFPAPSAPWIACMILDVSSGGVRLDVGALPVPKVFGLAFDVSGSVVRVCSIVWRRGELIGARFLNAKDLPAQSAPRSGEAKPYRRGAVSTVS